VVLATDVSSVCLFTGVQHGGRNGVLPLQQPYTTAQRTQLFDYNGENPAHWLPSEIKIAACFVSRAAGRYSVLNFLLRLGVDLGISSDSFYKNCRGNCVHMDTCTEEFRCTGLSLGCTSLD
jgi:hypothetical protein